MNDTHRHEWRLYDDGSGAFCIAHHERACMMNRDDVERRLNIESDALAAAQVFAIELKSENAELKKFLKHARDDKMIRLGEIEVLEDANVRLREAVQHTLINKIESEIISCKYFVTESAIKKLEKSLSTKETGNENPQN